MKTWDSLTTVGNESESDEFLFAHKVDIDNSYSTVFAHRNYDDILKNR